jgi:hypothetical protein
MKHITFNDALKMYESLSRTVFDVKRAPVPFPGRTSPTRVAWYISLGYAAKLQIVNDHENAVLKEVYIPTRFKVFTYVGKPNRYRALEALKLLGQRRVYQAWQIEFDRGGLLAYRDFLQGYGRPRKRAVNGNAYTAYHPHSANADIVASFAKPFYVKRIGRFSLYSHARKLNVEKLDAFYAWYEKTFGKKLRRPKQAPMEVESAETS